MNDNLEPATLDQTEDVAGLVYKAESPEGKTYVGCTTVPLVVRAGSHYAAAWSSRRHSYRTKWMQAVLDNIHDPDWLCWSVLEEVHGERWQLFARERWWIRHLDSEATGFNSTGGNIGPGREEGATQLVDIEAAQNRSWLQLIAAMGGSLALGVVIDVRGLEGAAVERAAVACFDARSERYRDNRRRKSLRNGKQQSNGARSVRATNRVLMRWHGLCLIRVGGRCRYYEVRPISPESGSVSE